MHARVFLALACALLILRLPSLVQPMGADQGLYAYVGERILAGELPYRDAWDQKPPAIHFAYALMRAFWHHDSVVPAVDLLSALAVMALLAALGRTLAGAATGYLAALLFLFLSDPSLQRQAGVAVRAQCETFIAVLVTGAFLLLARDREVRPRVFAAGLLFGAAAAFKYNAGLYAFAGLFALWTWGALTARRALDLVAGAALVPLALLLVFLISGTFPDLFDATISYNVQYSGETYRGVGHFLSYLLAFPVQHARVNGLWLLGGAGCAVLLAAGLHHRERLVAPAWVAAACLVIAVNGSRGLPQYFVQALPALAFAAACAWTVLTGSVKQRPARVAAIALLAFAVWRVNEFSNLVRNVEHDGSYAFGRISREEHLARYGDPGRRKYSALAMDQLGTFVRERTSPNDPIYVFGFSGGAYVSAERRSASRFCWSRPVIVGFNAHKPGYGVAGLRTDLERERPAIVALQVRDWMPDVQDSAEFFMSTPQLAEWLRANYDPVAGPAGYETWQRR
jgi:hypothetical protein